MPRGDGTGPMGMGPGTGRAAGYCTGYPSPGYMNPAPRRGFQAWGLPGRRSFGRGRGYRYWYYATGLPLWARVNPYMYGPPVYQGQPQPYGPQMSKDEEIEVLKAEAVNLEEALKEIKERLAKLEAE